MNTKFSGSSAPLLFGLLAILGLQTVAAWWGFDTKAIFIAQAALFFAMLSLVVWHLAHTRSDLRQAFKEVGVKLGAPGSDALNSFVLPLVILGDDGSILWYNEIFRTQILGGEDRLEDNAGAFLTDAARATLDITNKADLAIDGRLYTVYQSSYLTEGGETCRALYFVDDTSLKTAAAEYAKTRPAVMLIRIDSLDELAANLAESEQAAIRSAIEREIETWANQTSGVTRKLSNADYLLVVEERSLEAIIQNRFDVLEKVRSLTLHDRGGATLSIGVGRGGATLQECQQMARQALDMALGRGGDQAAVKGTSGFEFYGGATQSGVEKRTKVRTRVIASALRELIDGSDNVLIMGHRFSDLDCLGASFGLWRAVTSIERNCRIVMNREQTLAHPLLRAMQEQGLDDQIVGEADALAMCTRKTLLIVVDTHRPEFVDCPALLERCETVVVIDHHRKMVDYIDNAVIFYHEPYASSACEMVAELLQYFGERLIGRLEATALMAGIALDTRNFVLRTGVRTFEASAYLRSRGADPVEVKRMFSDSIEVYKERSAIVSSAELYGNCAIAGGDHPNVSRIAGAQAADELLSIDGVDASFVLFLTGSTVNISARSLGAVNVQLIMESLGGGGHFTMAATQIEGVSVAQARDALVAAIDRYRKTQSIPQTDDNQIPDQPGVR